MTKIRPRFYYKAYAKIILLFILIQTHPATKRTISCWIDLNGCDHDSANKAKQNKTKQDGQAI